MGTLDERMKTVGAREAQLAAAMAKVMSAEEAMEACLSCMCCMELLKEPTTCVPCGHTFCAKCLKERGGSCPECIDADGAVPLSIYPSVQVTNLETLASKFEFQKQALAAMATAAAAKAGSRRGSLS